MTDALTWVAGQIGDSPQTAMQKAFSVAVIEDQAAERADAERVGALELAAEQRNFAIRQSGVRPGALTERAVAIGDKTAELADLRERAGRVERELVQLRRAQEFDAELLQRAQELATRSAPIPGLGDLPRRSTEDATLIRAHARSALARIGVVSR